MHRGKIVVQIYHTKRTSLTSRHLQHPNEQWTHILPSSSVDASPCCVVPTADGEMGPTIPTPPASSTVTTSSVSHQSLPFRILEISLVSAQDLAPVSKSMRTYAVGWIDPNRKLTTPIDQKGHINPAWNEKFAFRVDDEFLCSDTSAITVEIYTISWLRHVLVGTVHVLIHNLISSAARPQNDSGIRFLALQIRRPSAPGEVCLLMLKWEKKFNIQSLQENEDNQEEKKVQQINEKIQFWRSLSLGTDITHEEFPMKSGSICNGSIINGSTCNDLELCSDVGPSASIVAAEIAKGSYAQVASTSKGLHIRGEVNEVGNSILEELTVEEAKAKGLKTDIERWRTVVPPRYGRRGEKPQPVSAHSRRHSDGGGLFSCFGNAYGFEFTIVCGASNNNIPTGNKNRSRKKGSSKANTA
ncbi:unnamed protein product [Ilex paraguariensis]|uniref:C2 domain-containing protein n=1 Tax=Ilex paraguariensis TaxID=185542 RepID=A0ABC8RH42_9AQUA